MKKMSVMKRKKFSVLVCALLVMSIFAALPAGMAWDWDEHPDANTMNANNHNMVEIVGMAVGSNVDPFYVGQEGVQFGVQIENINHPDSPLAHNPQLNAVRFNIQEVRGPDGTVTTTALDWEVDEDEGPYDIAVGATVASAMFEFSVAANNNHAPPGEYTIAIRVRYDYDHNDDGSDTAANEIEYLMFEIANNADVDDVDPALWAGETFQEMSVNVANDGGVLLDDASLTLSGMPSGISLRDSTARIPAGIAVAGDEDFFYRVDVDSDVAPGIYSIDYTFTATRDGVDITEQGELDLVVDFTPKISASAPEIIIEQGTVTETVEVTFENVGNVPLNEVYIGMANDPDYFPVAVEHYEYGDEVLPMPTFVGDLGVGGTTTIEFETGFHRFIQEGRHMLQFRWDGWYYDDGSTDEATRYYHVGVDWRDADPDHGIFYDVVEDNHMFVPGDDTIREEPWMAPHIFIEVTDEVVDMEGFVADAVELLGDITYIELEVTLQNFELVGFRDLEVMLEVGPGTPYLNPVDRTLTTVAMSKAESADAIGPYDTVAGPGEADIVFFISVNSEYVTDVLHGLNHGYLGSMVITRMINENTLEVVTDQTVPLTGELRGFGPRVVVEGEFSDNRVKAGEVFDLNYTLTNHGDDIARDTWVVMQPNLYNNEEWRIHDGFVRAIASDSDHMYSERNGMGVELESEETSNKSTEFSGVTLEALSIDSAKEIVELHMYVEGALSSPQPYIWVLYVGELRPGDEITVTFEMVSDRDMQIGKPYQETIFIRCIDTDGEEWEWEYPLTIRTREKGETYDPTPGIFGAEGGAMMMMLLLIVILVIVVAIFIMSRKGEGKPKKEKIPEATEPEYEPEPVPEPYEEPAPFEEEEDWAVEPEEEDAFEESFDEPVPEPEEDKEVW